MHTMRKIALEEHFPTGGLEQYWVPTVVDDPAIYNRLYAQLVDFGSLCLDAMDRTGIERSVVSLAGPPAAAAHDLERCIRDLGFCGALINGHNEAASFIENISLGDQERMDVSFRNAKKLLRLPPQQTKIGFAGDPGLPPQQTKTAFAGDPGLPPQQTKTAFAGDPGLEDK